MKIFSLVLKMISKASPLLLAVSSVAIVLAFLLDRHGSCPSAAKAIKDDLMVKDKLKNAATKSVQASGKIKGHRVAFAAASGVLTENDKGKGRGKAASRS